MLVGKLSAVCCIPLWSLSAVLCLNPPTLLPQDWDYLCPYTDFCTHKAAKSFNLTRNKKPCCNTCSCEPDCGLKRNCCLYSLDKYRLDETYRTTCTVLSTATSLITQTIGTTKYMTVDKCPNMASCYDFKAAAWGSMYPVISNKTGMIYLNAFCAECHGHLPVEKFLVEANCHMVTAYSGRSVSAVLRVVFQGQKHDDTGCFLRFLPPVNFDITHMLCYESTINTCLVNAGENGTDLTLCESFNATYTYMGRIEFANIYCFLCSRTLSYFEQICYNFENERTSDVVFSFLLGTHMLALAEEEEKQKDGLETHIPEGCLDDELMEKYQRRCRKLWCPAGQIRLKGQCSFISHEWLAGPFITYLRLDPYTPEDEFPVQQIDKLASHKGPVFKKILKHWSRDLYYRTVGNVSHVQYFVLQMIHKKGQFYPEEFIGSFGQALDSLWTLKVDGKRYRFKARIHKYQIYQFCTSDLLPSEKGSWIKPYHLEIENASYCTLEPTQDIEILILVHGSWARTTRRLEGVALTNFFFCYQIDLLAEEFVDYGKQIFLKMANRFLEHSEFNRNIALGGNETISICLDSLGQDFWFHGTSGTASLADIFTIINFLIVCSCLRIY